MTSHRYEEYRKRVSGQALLLVLLTMAVAIVVVLSVVSKSVTDVAITSTEEESLRAFSAAEAGVEQALLNVVPGSISETNPDGVTFDTTVSQDPAGSAFNYPDQLLSGETGTIWFVGHDNDGVLSCNGITCATTTRIQLCWGSPSTTEEPAVEVTLYYDPSRLSFLRPGNTGSVNYSGLRAYTLTADSAGRGFFDTQGISSGCSIVGVTTNYLRSRVWNGLNGTIAGCLNGVGGNCLVMVKVRLLYNTTKAQSFAMGISGTLPSQGYRISSAGYSDDTRTTQRKVEVFQGYPEPPSIFDSALFSLKGLEKD